MKIIAVDGEIELRYYAILHVLMRELFVIDADLGQQSAPAQENSGKRGKR